MISIRQNLRLYDGYNAMLFEDRRSQQMVLIYPITQLLPFLILSPDLLTDTGVTCQNICIFCDSQFRWIGVTDLQHTAPLCKDCSILFILCTAL